MHLFDTTDPEVVASRRNFYITIVVLSAATYATAFVAYWLVRSRKDDLIAANVQDGKVEKEEGSENASAEGEEIQAAPKYRDGGVVQVLTSSGDGRLVMKRGTSLTIMQLRKPRHWIRG